MKATETTKMQNAEAFLKSIVNGAYDIQQLRMQSGLRLCANFRAKLGLTSIVDDDEEIEAEAKKIIEQLKASFRRLTDGIAKKRTIPTKDKFRGDELISEFAELVLVSQYIELEQQEREQFRQLGTVLEDVPIYREYLANVRGIGPAMAGVLITGFDIRRAPYPSSFWKYAGLDVANGSGRSRRDEHLVDRVYTDKNGHEATRRSITYNPWLKTKLVGVLATSFMRSNSEPWRQVYDDYKHRIMSDPAREKVTSEQWKKRHRAKEDVAALWTPARINNAGKRYMIKQFLVEYWTTWRKLEGLPVTPTYHEAKLGHRHRDAA